MNCPDCKTDTLHTDKTIKLTNEIERHLLCLVCGKKWIANEKIVGETISERALEKLRAESEKYQRYLADKQQTNLFDKENEK